MSEVVSETPDTADVSEMMESELKELRQVGQLFRRVLGELDQVNASLAQDLEAVHRQLLRLDHRMQALEVVALGERPATPEAGRKLHDAIDARKGHSLGSANGDFRRSLS